LSNQNNEEQAVSEALIANVLNTRFEDLGPEVIDNSKRRIIDMIGNAIGGTRCDGNPEIAAMYSSRMLPHLTVYSVVHSTGGR